MKRITNGGGWPAMVYAFKTAWRAGGFWKFYKALRSRNACKTCALGMGGQRGGMVNEAGHAFEVCKKSMQAMAADMQGRVRPEFFEKYGFEPLRRMTPRDLEHMGRLAEPVYAGPDDTHYKPISWDRALEHCIQRLKRISPDENFFYSSGRSSNEAAFLLQLFARIYGTNNVNNCSYYCHQASGVGLSGIIGSGTATVQLEDLEHCDCVFLIGGNPASNHPRLMTILMDLRRRGGQVVVMNPLVETGLVNFRVPSNWRSMLFGSEIASLYIQPHIGGDIALLMGIAKRIDELNAADEKFIAAYTEGFEAFREAVRKTTWEEIQAASGVDRESMERAAQVYAKSKATVFAWTMGITHHVHGVDNVRAIGNLALLRGMVGRPHAGLMPIRGHSNVQGIGSVGFTPKLAQVVLNKLQEKFRVKLPTTPGMDTLSCMEAMETGKIKNAWCLGGNLFGSNPDAAATAKAFGQLESVVYFNTTLNTGHAWGRAKETLILPVKARDEEAQATTQESMFNYVRLSDGGPARLDGPRSEVELVAHLARGVLGDGGPLDWKSLEQHRNIRQIIAAVVPGYEAIGEIDQTHREFQVAGRTFHEPQFRTPTGRARFHAPPIPAPPPGLLEDGLSPCGTGLQAGSKSNTADLRNRSETGSTALRLMTIRSEGQFNTVVYEEHDLYRNQDRRDVILMNTEDIERFGLHPGQRVVVCSETGEMRGILVQPFAIRAGNAAMYYPEANVLVPRRADGESRTPAFKSIVVTVRAETPTARAGISLPVADSRR